jgi:hypothetical protein
MDISGDLKPRPLRRAPKPRSNHLKDLDGYESYVSKRRSILRAYPGLDIYNPQAFIPLGKPDGFVRLNTSSSFARLQVQQRLSVKLRCEDAVPKERFAFAHHNILRCETHNKVAISTISTFAALYSRGLLLDL